MLQQSQAMKSFQSNLTKRRDDLGMTVDDVVARLSSRGIMVAYSTVAGWFNGSRGARWKVDELRALLDVLQTDLETMGMGEAELIEEPVPAATAREMRGLTPAQQQVVLAMVRAMRGSGH